MPNNMKRAGKKYQAGAEMAGVGRVGAAEGSPASMAAGAIPGVGPAVGAAGGPPILQDPGAAGAAAGMIPGAGAAIPAAGAVTPQAPPANVLGAAAEAAKALGAKGRGGILSRGGNAGGNGVL